VTKPKQFDPEVPLFLIATAIASGVKRRGGKLFRISVVRTDSHKYLIKYKCRAKDACHTRASFNLPPSVLELTVPDEAGDHA
jgi:hypothetical protein